MSINPIIIYVEYSLPVYPVSFNFLFAMSIYTNVLLFVLSSVLVFSFLVSGFCILLRRLSHYLSTGHFHFYFLMQPWATGTRVVLSISTRDKKKKGQRRQVTYLRSHTETLGKT